MRREVEAYIRDARRSIWNLRSTTPDTEDLPARLKHLAKRYAEGLHVDLSVGGAARPYTPEVEEQLLHIAQEAVVNGDREALRQLAHAMRGSAAMLGAGHLHDLTWSLEMDAESSELPVLARAVNKVRVELDVVVAAIKKAHPEAWIE